MEITFDSIWEASESLKKFLPKGFEPTIGIICGSGLSAIADAIEPIDEIRDEISYADIKGFPVSGVQGHAGRLVFGLVGASKTSAVLMNGRAHFYEGHELQTTAFPIRVMRLLGIKILIVTNAVGGLNPNYNTGDIVIVQDHINFPGLAGQNPLRGPNLDHFGARFIPLSDAYDLELRRTAHRAWKAIPRDETKKMVMHEGTYAFVAGPNYETRAECRMLSRLGADTVGMSVVPEVITARHSGIRVLALNLITNMAAMDPMPRGDDPEVAENGQDDMANAMIKNRANHEEVLDESRHAANAVKKLIVKIIEMEMSKL